MSSNVIHALCVTTLFPVICHSTALEAAVTLGHFVHLAIFAFLFSVALMAAAVLTYGREARATLLTGGPWGRQAVSKRKTQTAVSPFQEVETLRAFFHNRSFQVSGS